MHATHVRNLPRTWKALFFHVLRPEILSGKRAAPSVQAIAARPLRVPAAGVFVLLLLGVSAPAHAQNVSFAGTQSAVGAGFSSPNGIAVDALGNVFIADTANSRVVEIPASGGAQILVGAGLSTPSGVALDKAGDVFIADTGNNRVVEVPAGGGTQTTVGTGLLSPDGVAVDALGDVFIADTGNSRVVEVPNGGPQTTVGTGLISPKGVALDAAGDLFIADSGNTSIVEIPFGSSTPTTVGTGLSSPAGLAVDGAGDVFIADTGNNRIEEVPFGSSTQITIGTGLALPAGVAVDGAGDVFIADTGNSRAVEVQLTAVNLGIANICPGGQTTPAPCSQTLTLNYNVTVNTTFSSNPTVVTQGAPGLDFTLNGTTCTGTITAGNSCTVTVLFAPLAPGLRMGGVQLTDSSSTLLATTFLRGMAQGPAIAFGPGVQALLGTGLTNPQGVAVDGAGDVFVADFANNRVVEIPAGGGSQTTLGTGLTSPAGVAVDGAGNIFIADSGNNRMVEVSAGGGTQTAVGTGLNAPSGVVVDGAGNIFIADSGNGRVVEISTGSATQSTVGTGLTSPAGVAVDGAGDVFIADSGNNSVVEVPAGGGAQTTVGTGLSAPTSVAVDGAGDVFIADSVNNRVVEVAAGGGSQTTVGTGLSAPHGVALDAAGDIFIADSSNNRLLEVQRSQPPSLSFAATAVFSTSADSPQAITVQNIGNTLLSAIPPGLSIGSASFTEVPGPGTPIDCFSINSLVPGASCDLSLSFVPQTTGSIVSSATFIDNTLNSTTASQSVTLSGTGVIANQTISFTTPAPVSASYYSAFPVAAQSTSGLTVALTVDSSSAGICSIGSSTVAGAVTTATVTMMSATGFCTIDANQSGNSNYNPATQLQTVAAAATIGTSLTVTNTNDSGFGSLRDAVANAVSGDTVNFSLPYPAVITLASTISINTSITISGPGSSNVAVSGNNAVQVFSIGGVTVTISGLTIENGNFNGYPYGGGIANGGTLTLSNSTVSGNSASYGGAIYNYATMTLTNSTVSGNSASYFAGIYNNGTMTFTNSTLSGNSASYYGGIFNQGTLTLSNSTVSGNSASSDIGGIYNQGTMSLSNSTVSGNSSPYLAGIYNYGAMSLTNTTVSGNSASYYGGIYNQGTMTLANTTVSGNSASSYYGGVYNQGTLTAKNSLFANNSGGGGNCVGNALISQGHNLSDDATCASAFTQVGDLNSTAPGLDPAGLKSNGGPTQTIALLLTSPAVDAIPLSSINYCTDTTGNAITTDQRGVTRPQGPACDIGAFELDQTPAGTVAQTVSFTTPAPTNANYNSTFPVAAQSTSGLPVALSVNSTSTSVCSLGASSIAGGVTSATVTMLSGTGTCTIFAIQLGDGTYTPAALQQTSATAAPINQATLTVTGPASVAFGTTGSATATGGSGTGALTFSVGGSTGCSVSGSTVTVTDATGNCSLTATQAADNNYNATTSAAFTVTLVPGSQTISFTTPAPSNASYGSSFPVAAQSTSGLTVTLTVDAASTGVCSLGASSVAGGVTSATVTILSGSGFCTIDANQSGSANYNAAPQQQTSAAAVPVGQTISFTTAAPSSASYNSTFPVAAQSTSGLTVSLSVDAGSTSVCSLGTSGVAGGITSATVTMLSGTGTCTIDANQTGGGGYGAAAQLQTSATAAKLDTFTYVTSTPNASTFGQSVTLTATVAPVPPGTGTPSGGTLTFMQGAVNLGTGTPLSLFSLPATSQGWSQIATGGTSPSSICNLPVVGDGQGDLILYGEVTCSLGSDLWVLSNANGLGGTPTWTQLFPTGGPPPVRHNGMAVYDPTTNSMIIYGGCEGGCFPVGSDVWVLSNANGQGGTPAWTQLSPSGTPPSPRITAAAAYDPGTNRMMIFAGQNGGGSACGTYSDTWVLTNANGTGGTPAWIQLSPTGSAPTGQYNPSSFYDTANNRLVVTGGSGMVSGSCTLTNSVWVLSNANGVGGTPSWTNLIPEGASGAPADFSGLPAVYDAANNRGLLQGQSAGNNNVWGIINANGLGGPAAWVNLNPNGGPAPTSVYGVVFDSTNNILSSLHTDNSVWTMSTAVDSITASYGGDANFNATGADPGSTATALPQTVNETTQTISFITPAPSSAGYNSTFPVAAQSTSGLTVALTVDSASTSVCSLGSPSLAGGITSATVTMLSDTGVCTIDANQSGDSDYSAAAQQQTSASAVAGTQATLTVTGPASVTYGTTGTATSTGGSGTGALSFSAGASTGCSVSGTTVSVTDASGTCSITATKAADSNYAAETSATFAVTLTTANQATLNVTGPASVTFGTTGTATATGGSGTGALSFSAGASTGCSVTGTTVSVTNAAGTCSLTATKAADNNYAATTSAAFAVTLATASQATLTVTGPSSVTYGTTGTATATGGSGTGTLSFSAGASTGCSVTGTTVSVTNASGTCSLTATKAADSNYAAATSAAFPVTLATASQATLTVTGPASVTYGTTGTATATGGSGTGGLSFSAGASTGCSVTGTTVSVTNAAGTCSLTATKAADNNYAAATSTAFPVTLATASQATLTVTGPASVTYGTTGTATAAGGSGTGALSFSAGASTGCSVSGTTVTVTNAGGTCSLTATKAADNNYAAATSAAFPVTLATANQAALTVTGPASVTYGTTGTATATGGSGTGALSFSAGASTGCSVSGTTVSVTNAGGTCSLTATKAADSNYAAATSAAFPVTLAKASATLTLSNLSQTYDGTPKSATVTTNPSALTGVSVSYTGTGGTVYGPTTTAPTNAGSYAVDASLTNANYLASDATGTLTIAAPALVSIKITPANPTIAVGLTQQFVATGTYSDNSTQNISASVTWTSATPAVATIGAASGLATAAGTGTSQITATSGSITSTVDTLTVNNPAPSIGSLLPGHAPAGTGFTLTVNGTGFVSTSTVGLNGKTEATAFVSATQLTATIPAVDISHGGAANVTVTSPTPGGGTSAASSFTIDDFSVVGPGSTVNVVPGQPTPISITINPTANGFAGAVQLAVLGLPTGTTAQFSQDHVTPGTTATKVTLTVTATAAAAIQRVPSGKNFPTGPLGLLMTIFAAGLLAMRKRSAWGSLMPARAALVLWLIVAGGLGASLVGCTTATPLNNNVTPPGNYTVTVTGLSGTAQHSASVTLSVE